MTGSSEACATGWSDHA